MKIFNAFLKLLSFVLLLLYPIQLKDRAFFNYFQLLKRKKPFILLKVFSEYIIFGSRHLNVMESIPTAVGRPPSYKK
jgi:hypothetical protein